MKTFRFKFCTSKNSCSSFALYPVSEAMKRVITVFVFGRFSIWPVALSCRTSVTTGRLIWELETQKCKNAKSKKNFRCVSFGSIFGLYPVSQVIKRVITVFVFERSSIWPVAPSCQTLATTGRSNWNSWNHAKQEANKCETFEATLDIFWLRSSQQVCVLTKCRWPVVKGISDGHFGR